MNTEYAYSTDEENYYGRYRIPDEAVAVGFSEEEDLEICWVAEVVEPEAAVYLDAEILLDHIREQEEYSLECADDAWGCTEEQRDDLTKMLRECFDAWAEKHSLKPGFFTVKNPQEWTREEAVEAGLADPMERDEVV